MSRTSGLGFFLFIVLNATLFIRPGELIEALATWPIYNVVILACLAASASAVLYLLSPASLAQSPIEACALGMLACAVLSHLTHLELLMAISSAVELLKVLAYFFLVVALLDTPSRFRQFFLWLCVFVTIMVSLALMHHYQVINIPALEAMKEVQWDEVDPSTGEPLELERLQATGIYGNPNDLSRILVVGILLCLYFLGDQRSGPVRALFILPMALFGQGLHLTHSRGGVLSLLAGIGVLLIYRLGRTKSLLLAAAVLPALLLVSGGRETNFSTSSGTGQERLKLWNEGFVLMKGSPIFGIGINRYSEFVGLVAHNSFVQCYVELGFIGGTVFFALSYLPLRALGLQKRDPELGADPEVERLRPYVCALVMATVVGMFSSTRSYSIPTYLIFGIAAAFLKILAETGRIELPRVDWNLARRLAPASLLMLAGFYVYVRLSARY